MTSMSRVITGAAVAAVMAAAAPSAQAFDVSKLTTRIGGAYIVPSDESKPIGLLGVPKNSLDVSNEWAPDIDFEYALTERIGLELLLTVPTKHAVVAERSALGPGVRLGSVTHLPPTLTAKYYLATDRVRPYIGAGVNVTRFTKDNLAAPGTPLEVENWSVGPALQAGVDVSLTDQWSLSLDAKRAWLRTDVSVAGGAKLTTVKIDPWILGLRVGYRFGGKPAEAPAPPRLRRRRRRPIRTAMASSTRMTAARARRPVRASMPWAANSTPTVTAWSTGSISAPARRPEPRSMRVAANSSSR